MILENGSARNPANSHLSHGPCPVPSRRQAPVGSIGSSGGLLGTTIEVNSPQRDRAAAGKGSRQSSTTTDLRRPFAKKNASIRPAAGRSQLGIQRWLAATS